MKQIPLQTQAPFLETLIKYAALNRIGFHTPGHRGGRSLGATWSSADLLALDLTEISGLDWERALADALWLAADFYQADQSYFLVQGATQGILGAVLGCFQPGDSIIIARNCHSAVINAVILAGLKPVYVQTDWLPAWGLPLGINRQALAKTVQANPDCKGVLLTNPTYQGVAAQVSQYREVVKERVLIIDEAHGGHLEWSGIAGCDAYQAADLWIQGTHKFLGSLTQTGMLHLKTGRVNPDAISNGLELISTTSPSFPLRAALDANRCFLANGGQAMFTDQQFRVWELREQLRSVSGLQLLEDTLPEPGYVVDPWKLTFGCAGMGLTGYETEAFLRTEHQIQVEYADLFQVTCLLSPWQEPGDFAKLGAALQALSRKKPKATGLCRVNCELPEIPPLVMNPREAVFAPAREVPLRQAGGRVAATVIAPYPPGIPLIAPGERIAAEAVAFIEAILRQGGRVNGVNPRGKLIRCVEGS